MLSEARCTAGEVGELSTGWRDDPALPSSIMGMYAPTLVACRDLRLSTCGQKSCAHLKSLSHRASSVFQTSCQEVAEKIRIMFPEREAAWIPRSAKVHASK